MQNSTTNDAKSNVKNSAKNGTKNGTRSGTNAGRKDNIPESTPNSPHPAPGIGRRMISMVYEAFLLFAVVFLAGLIFDIVTQSHDPLALRHVRQVLLFLVMAAYFIHSWTREGQTLAMKTWRIKLVKPGAARISPRIAAARYLLAWMWFLPALVLNYALELKTWPELGVMAAGVALWAATALLDKDRQFLHDKLLGTRLVQLPKNQSLKK
jgi:uncharacterized RDD family membrane protein YckC